MNAFYLFRHCWAVVNSFWLQILVLRPRAKTASLSWEHFDTWSLTGHCHTCHHHDMVETSKPSSEKKTKPFLAGIATFSPQTAGTSLHNPAAHKSAKEKDNRRDADNLVISKAYSSCLPVKAKSSLSLISIFLLKSVFQSLFY